VFGWAAQAAGGGGLVTVAIGLAGTAARTGAITAGMGLVGAFGPLAGAMLSTVSWRLALGLSLLALLAVPTVLRRVSPLRTSTDPGDTVGLLLVLGLVSALVLLPRFPVAALAAAAAIGVFLVRHVRRRVDGFLPHTVLRSRRFLGAASAACLLSTSYFALLYTVPRLLEQHWSADRIGLTTLVTLAAGSAASLLLARHTPGPSVMRAVLATAGGAAVALALVTPWPTAQATATAFAVFAMTAGVAWYASRLRTHAHPSAAVGLLTLCYQLGGAFGPALASLLLLGD
jgi:hypothetical protein